MKRFLAIILTLSIALSISMSVFAEGKATVTSGKILRLPEITSNAPINIPVGDAEYIEDSNGKLIKISDLMHFSNQQEADNYLAQLSKQLSKTVQYNPQISTATRSTHGDALVASKGVSTGTIELRVAYSMLKSLAFGSFFNPASSKTAFAALCRVISSRWASRKLLLYPALR